MGIQRSEEALGLAADIQIVDWIVFIFLFVVWLTLF